MLRTIFLNNYVIFLIVSVLVLLAVSLYFNFNSITEVVKKPITTLSDETKETIKVAVDKSSLMIGIQVVTVDFENNTRAAVYTYLNDDVLKKIYSEFATKNSIRDFPLFTQDDINNIRIIKLVNHEYNCSPFKETTYYKYVPEAASRIVIVCAISIPPSFGEFNGITSVYLNKVPSPVEKDQIRIFVKDIAQRISNEMEVENASFISRLFK